MMDGRFNHPRFTVRRRRHSTFYEVKRLVYREGTKINTCNLWPTCISPLYLGPPEMSKRVAPATPPLNKMWLDTAITKKHERRRGHNASIWSVCLMLFTELKSLKQPDKITWSSEKTIKTLTRYPRKSTCTVQSVRYLCQCATLVQVESGAAPSTVCTTINMRQQTH